MATQLQNLSKTEKTEIEDKDKIDKTISALMQMDTEQQQEQKLNTWDNFIKENPKYANVIDTCYSCGISLVNKFQSIRLYLLTKLSRIMMVLIILEIQFIMKILLLKKRRRK